MISFFFSSAMSGLVGSTVFSTLGSGLTSGLGSALGWGAGAGLISGAGSTFCTAGAGRLFHNSTITASGSRLCQCTPKNRNTASSTCTSTRENGGRDLARFLVRRTRRPLRSSCRGLHQQPDFAHVLLLQLVHDLEHLFVAHVLVRGDHHRLIRMRLLLLLQRRDQLGG